MTAVILKIRHLFKNPDFRVTDVFRTDEKFIHQLSAMFTCRDGKGGKLSSRASKMLYKPPGASYKEPLHQLHCWKLFVQL